MRNKEAREQLCKMVGEIAERMGVSLERIGCTCGRFPELERDIADEVIEEMWRRLTHPRFKTEGVSSAQPGSPGVRTGELLPNAGALHCWACEFVNDIQYLHRLRGNDELRCLKCLARLAVFDHTETTWFKTAETDRDIGEAARAMQQEGVDDSPDPDVPSDPYR